MIGVVLLGGSALTIQQQIEINTRIAQIDSFLVSVNKLRGNPVDLCNEQPEMCPENIKTIMGEKKTLEDSLILPPPSLP